MITLGKGILVTIYILVSSIVNFNFPMEAGRYTNKEWLEGETHKQIS